MEDVLAVFEKRLRRPESSDPAVEGARPMRAIRQDQIPVRNRGLPRGDCEACDGLRGLAESG